VTRAGTSDLIDLRALFADPMPHCAPDSMPEYSSRLKIFPASDNMG
jgi:hypothetical protein